MVEINELLFAAQQDFNTVPSKVRDAECSDGVGGDALLRALVLHLIRSDEMWLAPT